MTNIKNFDSVPVEFILAQIKDKFKQRCCLRWSVLCEYRNGTKKNDIVKKYNITKREYYRIVKNYSQLLL